VRNYGVALRFVHGIAYRVTDRDVGKFVARKNGAFGRRDVENTSALLALVMLPTSLAKTVTAFLLAPLWRNIMFALARGLVFTLDPSVGVTLLVISIIPGRNDVAFAGGHLLIYRRRRRNIDVIIDAFCTNGERDSERARKGDCQKRFPNVHKNSFV
jgi:hypothetical protein